MVCDLSLCVLGLLFFDLAAKPHRSKLDSAGQCWTVLGRLGNGPAGVSEEQSQLFHWGPSGGTFELFHASALLFHRCSLHSPQRCSSARGMICTNRKDLDVRTDQWGLVFEWVCQEAEAGAQAFPLGGSTCLSLHGFRVSNFFRGNYAYPFDRFDWFPIFGMAPPSSCMICHWFPKLISGRGWFCLLTGASLCLHLVLMNAQAWQPFGLRLLLHFSQCLPLAG